jgi:hypothetical protein
VLCQMSIILPSCRTLSFLWLVAGGRIRVYKPFCGIVQALLP